MGIRRSRRGRGPAGQTGAAAVEFALVVPILLLLLFGIMDFGFLINRASMVNNAARDAAREASLGEPLAAVEAAALGSIDGFSGVTVTVTCQKKSGGSCSYDDRESGDIASVTVNYAHEMITPAGMFFGDSIDISRTAQMRFE